MRIRESKRCFILFCMLGFLAGILYTNLLSRDYIASMGSFSDYFLEQYGQTSIDGEEFLWFVLQKRSLPLILVCALGCTRLRRAVAVGFLAWTGFSGGILMTSAVLQTGIRGIFLCLAALFPHFLFYGAAWVILLWYFFQYPKVEWNRMKTLGFFSSYGGGGIAGVLCEPGAPEVDDQKAYKWGRGIFKNTIVPLKVKGYEETF